MMLNMYAVCIVIWTVYNTGPGLVIQTMHANTDNAIASCKDSVPV